mmetsp:Transcript_21828/g.70670  ORF Transcript_21828/g.70670 Transcript_21828/m.70670 type:complete len:869 (-) Transcript_21828:55-2661(-)
MAPLPSDEEGDGLLAHSVAYGWYTSRAPSAAPPYELGPEYKTGSDEVVAALEGCAWMFPPGSRSSPAVASGAPPSSAAGTAGGAHGGRSGEAPARPAWAPPVAPERMFDLTGNYPYQHLQSEVSQSVVNILLAPGQVARPGDSLAQALTRALERCASQAYQVLISVDASRRPTVPESERQNLVGEAGTVMANLAQNGHINAEQDLFFALEAFGVSKMSRPDEQKWLCDCLSLMIKRAFGMAPEALERWRQTMRNRILNEVDLYSNIDVRAWTQILELVGAQRDDILQGEAFKTQVRLQLCMRTARDRYEGLRQAAIVVAELRRQSCFTREEFLELFNDRRAFDRQQRTQLLLAALRGGPRGFVQAVLGTIDSADVDISERDDDEMRMVEELLKSLKEDIRCCPHAFFKMKTEWIAARNTGVVVGEELSPEQICDHIEDEPNHEDCLRIAVNRYLKANRKFEAARMLVRPKTVRTRVYESNRNDKQLAYLISLFNDVEPDRNHFGPIEEGTLVLPSEASKVLLYIQDAGAALERLESETVGSQQPKSIGIWWFWRCFNPKIDFWPRASFLALCYDGPSGSTFAIVDFDALEEDNEGDEERSKDVVRRILESPSLLKVVHDMDGYSFEVLQRAVMPKHKLYDEGPDNPWPRMEPVVDVSVVAAYIRRTRPCAEKNKDKLSGLVFEYLRLELCLAEAMSNFERRPLRLTQLHYALSLAWCPLLILRALCSFEIVDNEEILLLSHRVGHPGSAGWTRPLRNLCFAPDASAAAAAEGDALGGIYAGAYAEDLWTGTSEEAEVWRRGLPRPDRSIRLAQVMQMTVAIHLPPDTQRCAQLGIAELFSRETAARDLAALYRAHHGHRNGQQAPDAY